MGYWSTHKYERMSVKAHVTEGFPGWQPLKELISLADSGRNRAFLICLFATGSRVSECLSLRSENFEVRPEEGIAIIRGAMLEKRYRKISQLEGGKWVTEKLSVKRKPFPLVLKEPLTAYLLEWVNSKDGLLFPSTYTPRQLTWHWAYHLIRELDLAVQPDLRKKLGVKRLWLHLFRSWRASQLASDYGLDLESLLDYFSWEHLGTAKRYSRLGWKGLAARMKPVNYL